MARIKYKPCLSCGGEMEGITDHRAREICDECDGKALNTSHEIPEERTEQTLERIRQEKADFIAGKEQRIEAMRKRAAQWTPPKAKPDGE